jgi:hypothetical protein
VLLIRRIRELLYDQGFTISGARNRLADVAPPRAGAALPDPDGLDGDAPPPGESIIEGAAAMLLMHPAADRTRLPLSATPSSDAEGAPAAPVTVSAQGLSAADARALRTELLSIRDLLGA